MDKKNCEEKCSIGNTNTIELDDGGRKVAWCFTSFEEKLTINGINLEKNEEMLKKFFKYFCFSPEVCPTTQRKHFQGFFCLIGKNGMSLSTIKKKINGKWKLIPSNGSAEQNRTYCGGADYEKCGKKKEKNPLFFEWGVIPNQGKRTDLTLLKDEILKGDKTVKEIRHENPMVYHQYGRTLEKLEDDFWSKQFRTKMPKTIWYYGTTGVGKSHKAFENYNPETCYILNTRDGGFWEGYEGQKKIIINEFRGEIPFSELLTICDKWPYKCKRKCRSTFPLLAEEIIITSCSRPEEIYSKSLDDDDKMDQFLRRCEVIELKKDKR